MKDQRVRAAAVLPDTGIGNTPAAEPLNDDEKQILSDLADAMLASRIISYTQGFSLIMAASSDYGWDLQAADLAEIWQGGCIIRSALLAPIKKAFGKNSTLESLLFDDYFAAKNNKTCAGMAPHCRAGGSVGNSSTGYNRRAFVLRRLQGGTAAGQHDSGPARLLRRPHV